MSNDDETVERVKEMILAAYLDMDASDLAKRMNAGMSAREALRLSLNGIIPEVISAYRHAALSALPERELLREALEALEPFAKHAEAQFAKYLPPHVASDDSTPVWGNSFEDDADVTVGDLRRARAAADKIRAALGGE